MTDLTVADLAARIDALRDDLAKQNEQHQRELALKDARIEEEMAIVQTLLARQTDQSHVSKHEAAVILTQRWHRKVSVATVGRMIARGLLSFERIPGTRQQGIPMDQVRKAEASYVSTRAARSARKREVSRDR